MVHRLLWFKNHTKFSKYPNIVCFIYKLEIPASRVFLGADAQLLGISLADAKMPLNVCFKAQLNLNMHSLALPCSAPCKWGWIYNNLTFNSYKGQDWSCNQYQRSFFKCTLLYLCIESEFWLLKAFMWPKLNVGLYGLHQPLKAK